MKNIQNIHDLTDEQKENLFFAIKRGATAFVALDEPCVVLTSEGNYRIDEPHKYWLAIGKDGTVWSVLKTFFDDNYDKLELLEPELLLNSYLTK
jgi:hypothetical protein